MHQQIEHANGAVWYVATSLLTAFCWPQSHSALPLSLDYQMAAVLLRLPSIIRSEKYQLINPHAHIAYINHVQKEEQAEKILDRLIVEANNRQDSALAVNHNLSDFVDDDVDHEDNDNEEEIPPQLNVQDPQSTLYQLGYMHKYPITEGKKTYKILFPQCSLYPNRGQRLKHLNRLGYAALIKFNEPSSAQRKILEEFQFSEGFLLHGLAVQTIMQKQRTPLVIRKPPRYPGKRPDANSPTFANWLARANSYAEFYLVLFRPEPDCCENNQRNLYDYTWDALDSFVHSLEHDNSIISKFRLVAMHVRSRGFITSFQAKLILTKYRGRERDLWTRQQMMTWEVQAAWERQMHSHNDILEQYAFEMKHKNLSGEKTQHLQRRLSQDTQLRDAYCSTFNPHVASHSDDYLPFPTTNKQPPFNIAGTAAHIQHKGTCIRHFDTEGLPPTADLSRKKYSYHLCPILQRKHKHRKVLSKFNEQQWELYNLYKDYFKTPHNEAKPVPQIVMLHGGAGTGKSTLLNAILDYAEFNKKDTLRTAFNGINAIHIGGDTTHSVLYLKGDDANTLSGLLIHELDKFREIMGGVILIVVDELSNQAPYHLAKLSKACQQLMNNELPFGGIPIILCGDLIQLEPVKAGASFANAVIQMCENVWCTPSNNLRKKMVRRQLTKEKNMERRRKNNDPDKEKNPYDPTHPFAVGANIIRHARLFELTEQVRSKDKEHSAFVTNLYNCRQTTMQELCKIPVLSKKDFFNPESPWFAAPVLVLTHREQFTINHVAAVRFAKAKGKPVIRWKAWATNWKQSPDENVRHQAYRDPCFYEYFVQDGPAFLTARISKQLGLVNARPLTCHSISMKEDDQQAALEARIQSSVPGEIITLPIEPLSVNMQLNINDFSNEQLQNLEHFRINIDGNNHIYSHQQEEVNSTYTDTEPLPSIATAQPIDINTANFTIPKKKPAQPDKPLEPKQPPPFIIPITAGLGKLVKEVPVYGNDVIKPSIIDIRAKFPFQLSFAITVNKSEGQTMPNAILALSYRQHTPFNVDHRRLTLEARVLRSAITTDFS